MAEQRLPRVNDDDGTWGAILNTYLNKEHYNDNTDNPTENGGHKTITIRAGTTAALSAPLKFTSGSLMTAAEAGAVEFLTDKMYYTTTTPTRMTIAAYPTSGGATGDIYYRSSSGSLTVLPVGTNTHVLTLSGGVPGWVAIPAGGSYNYGLSHAIGAGVFNQ